MILKGSERGHARELARHLLNAQDNNHIEVHAINGFLADDVAGAFEEIEAVSRATKCKKFLFSLSLSPPEGAAVSNEAFEIAIDDAMRRLGLAGQPHVVIFHEKHGRRHCHLVVIRIDGTTLKAINLPFFKDRLCQLSHELYLRHGWEVPKGHENRAQSDPLNYALEEYQVAKRANRDPHATKALLQSCWSGSDNAASFKAALADAGFALCKGDRHGFIAVDETGKVYSLSRWLGVKSKDLQARLGDPQELPGIEETRNTVEQSEAKAPPSAKRAFRIAEIDARIEVALSNKAAIVAEQRRERTALREHQEVEYAEQVRSFSRPALSLRGLWETISGTREQRVVERKQVLHDLSNRHADDMQALSDRQRRVIRDLRQEIAKLRDLKRDLGHIEERTEPHHPLVRPATPDLVTADQIRKHPERILEVVSARKEVFSRGDIARSCRENGGKC